MNVLVIGGAGYIGSHVVYELVKKQYNVIVLDDLSTGNLEAINKKAKFYQGSQLDNQVLDQIFKNEKIDVVMHFSAKLIVPESVKKPIKYFENNVFGVIQILKSMKKYNVKNIIFSSTAAVYGEINQNTPIEENAPKNPMQPYGQSKLACEWLIKGAHKAKYLNYVIFRYFNVAGANLEAKIGQATKGISKITHLIPVVMEVANGMRQKLEIYGDKYATKDGTCVRDYVHVLDLANAHVLGLDYVLAGKSNTFNLGSNGGFSVLEILNIASKVTKIKIPYVIAQNREGDPPFLVAASEKAKKLLKWTPQYKIEEIIESDFKWRKDLRF